MGRHVSLSSAFTVRCRCAQTAAAAPMRQRSCPACCACACPNCAPSHLRSASTHLWPSAACPAPAHPPSPAGCAPRARWRPPGRRRRPPPRGCEPRGGAPGCTAGRGSPPTAGGQAGRHAEPAGSERTLWVLAHEQPAGLGHMEERAAAVRQLRPQLPLPQLPLPVATVAKVAAGRHCLLLLLLLPRRVRSAAAAGNKNSSSTPCGSPQSRRAR
jgi:hypothetical protein